MFSSVQLLSHVWLCDPMDCSMPGFPVHHPLPEFTQTHVLWVGDAIQSSQPLSSPSPPTFNLSQHQGLFQWVSSSHQVAKVLEFPASTSVLPMNTQDWSPLGWTGLISLQFKGLSRVLYTPLYLWPNIHKVCVYPRFTPQATQRYTHHCFCWEGIWSNLDYKLGSGWIKHGWCYIAIKKKIDAHVSGKWILRTYYFSQKCKTEENVYHNIIDTNLDT